MPYTTTTLNELRYLLQTSYTDDPFWTVTEADDAINEALRTYNLYTGYWRTTVTIATGINTPFVTLPAPLTAQTRVYRDGLVLTKKSIVGWYRSRRNWRTETILSGGGVPTTIREWAPVGVTQIAIWPLDPVGATLLFVDGVRQTPILLTDASTIDIGDEEQEAVLAEALWILAFKRPSLLESLKPQHQEFLQAVMDKNDRLRQSAYFRAAAGLNQHDRLEPVRATRTEAP